ncbi:phasin family protein [Thauera sinica]|uniref:Phasin family protein n=1 Tax=Thauera sinica TaxID=2665146 RepID=A0ABW1AV26_9RHOO|nr:phasin family protein [Thauera sp. K11]ATE59338.1 phasin [Thauera sp. K11]
MTSMPSVQQIADTANTSIQHFVALADIVLNASEQLVGLNIDAARSACEFASSNAVPLTAEDIKEQISSRVAASGQGFEKAANYLRSVNEICAKTHADVVELNARHAGEYAQSVQSLFDSVAKLAPAGTFDFSAPAQPAKTTTRKSA